MEVDIEKKSEAGGAKKKRGTRQATLRGIVVPVDWDENGTEVAFALSTWDEDEYRITRDGKGKELKALMREEVEVVAEVEEQENKKIITIKKYSPTKS